jgi:hypothetical protein
MAFAIFYEPEDVSQIAGSVNAQTLPTALKNEARKYWNNGLKDWATAPVGTFPGDELSCPLCRTVVIDGPGLTLAGFIQVCLDIAAFIGGDAGNYLTKLANDMQQTGRDPWP